MAFTTDGCCCIDQFRVWFEWGQSGWLSSTRDSLAPATNVTVMDTPSSMPEFSVPLLWGVVECRAKQSKCTLCVSAEHLANQDLNYQYPERDDFPEANSMGEGESSTKPDRPDNGVWLTLFNTNDKRSNGDS